MYISHLVSLKLQSKIFIEFRPKASYEHVPEKPVKKNAKDYVDENGKVKT